MISHHLFTDAGERGNNEDHVGMLQIGAEFCFALADGLGGHGKGEVASQIAVEQAIATFAQLGAASEECMKEAMKRGQDLILETQKTDRAKSDMKTTFVLLLIGKDRIQWAHIGDSRLYYFDQKKLLKRTSDHSVPQMLVSAGELKEKQIRRHPDRNRLVRVMGVDWEEPKYQLEDSIPRKSGQAFLLCTDGFWEFINEKKMVSCLKKAKTPENWILQMKEIIIKQGKGQNMDNFSAIAVWVD